MEFRIISFKSKCYYCFRLNSNNVYMECTSYLVMDVAYLFVIDRISVYQFDF